MISTLQCQHERERSPQFGAVAVKFEQNSNQIRRSFFNQMHTTHANRLTTPLTDEQSDHSAFAAAGVSASRVGRQLATESGVANRACMWSALGSQCCADRWRRTADVSEQASKVDSKLRASSWAVGGRAMSIMCV